MSAGDSWRCLASAGSRPLLLAWPSLGLPKLSSIGPAEPSGSDPGLELEGRGAASLHCGRVAPTPRQPGRGVLTLGSQERRKQKQPWLQAMAVALPSIRLFSPVSLRASVSPTPALCPDTSDGRATEARVAMRSLLVWVGVRRSGPRTQCRGRGQRRRLLGCS